MFGQFTYMIFELAWAVPILALHWVVGGGALRGRLGVLLLGALLPTAYLTAIDSVALHAGIWRLHPDRILGLKLGNVPIEETIFFLVTDLMIVQTLILFHSAELQRQASRTLRGLRRRPRRPRDQAATPYEAEHLERQAV